MDAADSTDESADDITAADTAPSPMKVTAGGHRYCITIGRMSFSSSSGMGTPLSHPSTAVQSEISS